MATASKKAAPAKTSKKAATAEAAEDDLLSTKPKGKKAAAPAKTTKKPAAKAAAAEDDLLATKPKGKKAAAAAPAKKAPKPKAEKADDGTVGTRDDVRAVLLKTKKATSFADVATANNFNVRMVRRTARALRDEGLVEISREGTTGLVRKV